MRAELTDGTVVRLSKECECINHEGPHWVYAWHMNRDATLCRIKPLIKKMDTIRAHSECNGGKVSFSELVDFEVTKLAVGSYAGDMARIYGDALREFTARGIARLINECGKPPIDMGQQPPIIGV